MSKDISKYFWDLNKSALEETREILRDHQHPRFAQRLVTLLSRCQEPKELFSLISKKDFVSIWPGIRSYWVKVARESDFRDWWQAVYEQVAQERGANKITPKGKPSAFFTKIGRMIRSERINKGLSQAGLAAMVSMKQPDISGIEEGKKNITLETLISLCKALGIKRIDLE